MKHQIRKGKQQQSGGDELKALQGLHSEWTRTKLSGNLYKGYSFVIYKHKKIKDFIEGLSRRGRGHRSDAGRSWNVPLAINSLTLFPEPGGKK